MSLKGVIKVEYKKQDQASRCNTVVEHSTIDLEIEGSNTARLGGKLKEKTRIEKVNLMTLGRYF